MDRPWKLKFIRFSFYQKEGEIRIRVHPKSVTKFKQRLKEITGNIYVRSRKTRSNAMSMYQRTIKLKQVTVGWVNYYGIIDMERLAKTLDN